MFRFFFSFFVPQQSDLFLSLVLQLRTLTLQQLNDVWQAGSFKCFDDWSVIPIISPQGSVRWYKISYLIHTTEYVTKSYISFCHYRQPLLEALSTCGSEACVQFTTNLILNKEISQDHIISFLNSVTFISHPTPPMISHISVSSGATEENLHLLSNITQFTIVLYSLPQNLLKFPLLRLKTILALSSLIHCLCRREQTPCSQIPEVQQLAQVLKEDIGPSCRGQEPLQITEVQSWECSMLWEGRYTNEVTDAGVKFSSAATTCFESSGEHRSASIYSSIENVPSQPLSSCRASLSCCTSFQTHPLP